MSTYYTLVYSYIFITHIIFNNNNMRLRMVSSNLSFIFHHSRAMIFVFWHFCICRNTTIGGAGRETCAIHMRAAPATGGGGYPPPSSTTASCYVCTAITWTSTDTSTSSNASFIIVKFKNTSLSEIIMNERKNVDDKRNCLYIYIVALTVASIHIHTHTLPLSISLL